MENSVLVSKVKLYADLLELHEGDPFKIRALRNAYSSLKKVAEPINQMDTEALTGIPGIGKASAKIIETIAREGSCLDLDRLMAITPEGVMEMFNIKGVGPKRISRLWKDMNIHSVGELIQFCIENRLRSAKGFGEKSQQEILEKSLLYQNSRGKWLYARLNPLLVEFEAALVGFDIIEFRLTGQAFRKEQVVDEVVYIVDADVWPPLIEDFVVKDESESVVKGTFREILNVTLVLCAEDVASEAFVASFAEEVDRGDIPEVSDLKGLKEDKDFFTLSGKKYIPPELRWSRSLCELNPENLIEPEHIRGVVHTHTLYSDGIHTIKEMCSYAMQLGYEYIAISDHSQSAVYANGLQVERVLQQHKEIDALAKEFPDFRILKSIESDIKSDGSLDYEDDVLDQFDFVIGSIHSDLNMDIEKATNRLIKAIEHPYMNILGHMTGRLLLARKGYPVDIEKVLDACVRNKVVVEINANPQRLDIDYTLMRKATDKGVQLSINPDAHSKHGISDIQYGVIAARCGGVERSVVINSYPVDEFLKSMQKQ